MPGRNNYDSEPQHRGQGIFIACVSLSKLRFVVFAANFDRQPSARPALDVTSVKLPKSGWDTLFAAPAQRPSSANICCNGRRNLKILRAVEHGRAQAPSSKLS